MTNPFPETDAEDFVIAYLVAQGIAPATQISAKMPATPTLPFILVQRVAGGDDFIVDEPTVQVDVFNDQRTDASTFAMTIRNKMRYLRGKTVVTMPDGSKVNAYGPTVCEMAPVFMPWNPEGGGTVLSRYVARYRVKLRLPSIPL